MKQIYTRTGDAGETSLRGGVRVAKDDPRIESNGQIDHLNALLGVVRAAISAVSARPPGLPLVSDFPDDSGVVSGYPADTVPLLRRIQSELMTIMSHIATPDGTVNPRQLDVDTLTTEMERAIDAFTAGRSVGFVVPGDTLVAAHIHVARTQCRTVERRLWTLNREHPLPAGVLTFFNRLSDYLFALTLI